MNATDKIDLQLFCSTRGSEEFRSPFRHGDYVYACNGYIVIRRPADPEMAEGSGDCQAGAAKLFTKYDWSNLKPLELPRINETFCDECNGAGQVYECQECEGEGEVEVCNEYSSYDVTCDSCYGKGHGGCNASEIAAMQCPKCFGQGAIYTSARSSRSLGSHRCTLLGKTFSCRYLKMISHPGLVGKLEFNFLMFSFGEYQGLLAVQ